MCFVLYVIIIANVPHTSTLLYLNLMIRSLSMLCGLQNYYFHTVQHSTQEVCGQVIHPLSLHTRIFLGFNYY